MNSDRVFVTRKKVASVTLLKLITGSLQTKDKFLFFELAQHIQIILDCKNILIAH